METLELVPKFRPKTKAKPTKFILEVEIIDNLAGTKDSGGYIFKEISKAEIHDCFRGTLAGATYRIKKFQKVK